MEFRQTKQVNYLIKPSRDCAYGTESLVEGRGRRDVARLRIESGHVVNQLSNPIFIKIITSRVIEFSGLFKLFI